MRYISSRLFQTSCHTDKLLQGVTLINSLPFGRCTEQLVNDHHHSDLNVSFFPVNNFFLSLSLKCHSLKLYHNSFLSLWKQVGPQTKFRATPDEILLWIASRQPAHLFASNIWNLLNFECKQLEAVTVTSLVDGGWLTPTRYPLITTVSNINLTIIGRRMCKKKKQTRCLYSKQNVQKKGLVKSNKKKKIIQSIKQYSICKW